MTSRKPVGGAIITLLCLGSWSVGWIKLMQKYLLIVADLARATIINSWVIIATWGFHRPVVLVEISGNRQANWRGATDGPSLPYSHLISH